MYLRIIFGQKRENKVLILPQHIHIGGTSSYFRTLCIYFIERGFEVEFLLFKREINDGIADFIGQMKCRYHLVENELNHLEYWYDRKHTLRFEFLYSFLKQSLYLCNKFHCSQANLFFISNAFPGDLFPVFLVPARIRFVIHSMPWGRLDNGNRFMLERMIPLLTSRAQLITVSAYAKNRIQSHWVLPLLEKKVCFIHNSSLFANALDSIPERDNMTVTILTAGSVIETKNPFLWIKVAEKLTQSYSYINFLWAGDGEHLDLCRSLSAHKSAIRFLGNVKDMSEMYTKADIYFQPSKWESQGLAVLEAMSYGLPCVVTSNGGTAEMIESGISGFLVEAEDEQSYIDNIERLILDPLYRVKMGRQAFDCYRENFSREKWVRKMDEMLK